MKKLFTALLLASSVASFAQKDNVGIGTTQPDNSAILDLSSSEKGFLMPRMTESQRNAIKMPAQGLQIFQTDGVKGNYTFDGVNWINSTTGISAAADPWLGGGNAAASSDFIGTTNTEPLRFKVNNVTAGFIGNATQTNLFFGYNAGRNSTGNENVALGNGALFANTTGFRNIAIGSVALTNASNAGSNNIAIGRASLSNNTGANNIAVGLNSMSTNTSGNFNVAIGALALQTNQTGNGNIAVGNQALQKVAGSYNVGLGANAMVNLQSGTGNFGMGQNVGFNLINGSSNVFIGSNAGYHETGSNKLYIGSTSIAPSPTDVPLIYGDFSAKYVTIGDVSPSLRNQGTATGGYNLLVKGGILTEKVKVALAQAGTDWADYVFDESYKLMPLNKVEQHIKLNKHLPNVPSAEEMIANGLDVSQTSKIFMEKIEELTLYIIDLNKQIQELKK